MLPGKLLFKVNDSDGEHLWLLDAPNKKIEELKTEIDADVVISVPALVINDCVRRKMFSVWSASKRLEIQLKDEDSLKRLQGLVRTSGLLRKRRLAFKKQFFAPRFSDLALALARSRRSRAADSSL